MEISQNFVVFSEYMNFKINRGGAQSKNLVGQNFFVHFLGELKKPKCSFEINWPLPWIKIPLSSIFLDRKSWGILMTFVCWQISPFDVKITVEIIKNSSRIEIRIPDYWSISFLFTVRAPYVVCIFFTPFFSAREVNITDHLST